MTGSSASDRTPPQKHILQFLLLRSLKKLIVMERKVWMLMLSFVLFHITLPRCAAQYPQPPLKLFFFIFSLSCRRVASRILCAPEFFPSSSCNLLCIPKIKQNYFPPYGVFRLIPVYSCMVYNLLENIEQGVGCGWEYLRGL